MNVVTICGLKAKKKRIVFCNNVIQKWKQMTETKQQSDVGEIYGIICEQLSRRSDSVSK